MNPDELLAFALTRWETSDADVMGIEDAYKWLFHATQGGEHAIATPEGPRRWLEQEWATLTEPAPGETAVEPLRPDGAVVRLHLRPFRAAGGDPDALLSAFVASARAFRGDRTEFAAAWESLRGALAERPLGPHLNADGWAQLDAAARPLGYPAVHHSPRYEEARRPAYRVLTGDEAARLLGTAG
jgi:hypothetical protein